MKNFIQIGDVLTITAPADVVSGQFLLVGAMFGCVTVSALNGQETELRVGGGVYSGPKASGQSWTVGTAIYWDNSAKNFTTTASGNTKVGVVAVAAASGDTVGRVRLNGSF